MLRLQAVEAGYGSAQVLFGVSFAIEPGACVSLMGRNGMGKTTTVRVIMGQLPLVAGTVERFGNGTAGRESFELARAGIGLVPEGRQIFSNLTVAENLETFHRPARDGDTLWTMDTVLDLFPRLRERLGHAGNNLSGGEQQMLAIGRALMTNPRLLILDEATEGLAPIIRQQNLGLPRHAEGGRTVDLGHRQKHRRAGPPCRPSLHPRKRPSGLAGRQHRTSR
ncbi:MAG: hypothetical protein CM15mP115_07700 [Alphaproteobacteria bacterium]|nr:MAG: hypothetical protein CM15mP115_07700 [Alphaproteobacteria bacterium]